LWATNRDLKALAETRGFRSDLYFRMDGFTVTIPPLRDRAVEIEPLARLFVAKVCKKLGRPPLLLSPNAIDRLKAHRWPGNVRELFKVIERAVTLSQSTIIDTGDLLLGLGPGSKAEAPLRSAAPVEGTLRNETRGLERQRITEALERTSGNQTKA